MSINQTLSSNMLVEVAYAGSKGTKLAERVNINQAVLPDPSNITPIVTRRPFPNFGDILSANWQENSNYNALQTRLERRFSGDFSFLIGVHVVEGNRHGVPRDGGSWHQNAYRLRDDRGNSDFDVRQRLTVSVIYQLPFGRGKNSLAESGGVVNAIIGGWSANMIGSFMTGNFFSVTVPGDRANVGGYPFQRANRTCDGNLPRGDRTITATSIRPVFSLRRLERSATEAAISWRFRVLTTGMFRSSKRLI